MSVRVAALTLLALATALTAGAPALAQDAGGDLVIGVTPDRVAVTAAQGGQTYVRQVVVQNPNEAALTVSVERFGVAGSWTSVTPAGTFTVPARGAATLTLSIAPPAGIGPGNHTGAVQVVAQTPPSSASGTGVALRPAATLRLDVATGGAATERLVATSFAAADVEEGQPPVGLVDVRNEGNVAAAAHVSARVLRDGQVVMQGMGSRSLRPGETGVVAVSFAEPLPLGNYLMELRLDESAEAGARTVDFRVVRAGELGRSGLLRYLAHEAWARPGDLVPVTAVFENVGASAIARARFTAQVIHDGHVVEAIASEPLAVGVGRQAELVAYVRPPEAGQYVIVGKVNYDGLETPTKRSVVNAVAQTPDDAAPHESRERGVPGPGLGLLVAGLAAAAAVAAARRRR